MAPPQPQSNSLPWGMRFSDALSVLIELRQDDQLVVTNQGSSRLWPRMSQHPCDFHYVPSAMGGAIPFALGLALAQPQREVLVVSGDGSLLMNLGCLVTVVDSRTTNLTIVLIDNRIYEITGGQKTPGHETRTDYGGLAQSAGFPNVAHCWSAEDWRRRAPEILAARGPRFVWLEVAPEPELDNAPSGSIAEQLQRLREALRV